MNPLPSPRYTRDPADPDWLNQAVQFHGHLGPWATAGLRAGMAGRRAAGANGYFDLSVTVEGPFAEPPKSCFLDGLQVSTGATLGKRNLQWIAGDEIVVRIRNTKTGAVAEVRPTKKLVELVTSFAPATTGAGMSPDGNRKSADDSLEATARQIARLPEPDVLTVRLDDPMDKERRR